MKLSSGRWSEPRQLLIQQTVMGPERATENKPAQTVINNIKWFQISFQFLFYLYSAKLQQLSSQGT